MQIDIIHTNFRVDIHGYSGIARNKDYVETAFALMDKMWQTVKATGLPNKGITMWVFESDDQVFVGVELTKTPSEDTGLERKTLDLPNYAYYKHVGPYSLIKQVGETMREEIKKRGVETCWPWVEIYGHMTNDETKLETELLVGLQ